MNQELAIKQEELAVMSKALPAQLKTIWTDLEVRTLADAIKAGTPTLGMVTKAYNGDTNPAKAMLVLMLGSLIKFFSVGRGMDDQQLNETANLILQDYYFLKIEDFKLCFNAFKKGQYIKGGKLFDRLDGQIILQALELYCQERTDLATQLHLEEVKNANLDAGKNYLVQATEKTWVRDEGQGSYVEVEQREMATLYTKAEAFAVKCLLGKISDDDFKVVFNINYDPKKVLEEKAPELAKAIAQRKTKKPFEDFKHEVLLKKAQIEADASLSQFEKCNKIRVLTGLIPLTELEFNNRKP